MTKCSRLAISNFPYSLIFCRLHITLSTSPRFYSQGISKVNNGTFWCSLAHSSPLTLGKAQISCDRITLESQYLGTLYRELLLAAIPETSECTMSFTAGNQGHPQSSSPSIPCLQIRGHQETSFFPITLLVFLGKGCCLLKPSKWRTFNRSGIVDHSQTKGLPRSKGQPIPSAL
jgi:hypothetical protein